MCRQPLQIVALGSDYQIIGCSEHRQYDRVIKAERIRTRKSYQFFVDLRRLLNSGISDTEKLHRIFDMLDAMHAFGSSMHAAWAEESLVIALEDNKG